MNVSYFSFYKILIITIFLLVNISSAFSQEDQLKLIINNYDYELTPVRVLNDNRIIFDNFSNLEIWDLKEKKLIKTLKRDGFEITVTDGKNICFALIRRGKVNIRCPNNERFELKKIKILQVPLSYDPGVYVPIDDPEYTIFKGEKHAITIYQENSIKIWDKYSGKLIKKISGFNSHIERNPPIEVKNDEIKAFLQDKTFRTWNRNTGNLKSSTYLDNSDKAYSYKNKYYLTNEELKKLKISKDNISEFIKTEKGLIIGTNNGEINFYSKELSLIHTIKAHKNSVSNLLISKDKLISGSASDKEISIWDIKTFKLLHKINNIKFLDWFFLSNNESLITADSFGEDKTIDIWDIKTGLYSYKSIYHDEQITDMTLFNDKLITSFYDKTIKVWDLKSRKLLFNFNNVNGINEINNGYLYSNSDKIGELKVWSLKNGKLIRRIKAYNQSVSSLIFSTKKIYTVGNDNVIKIWDLEKKHILKSLNLSHYQSDKLTIDKNNFYIANNQNQIEIFDLASGKKLKKLSEKSKPLFLFSENNNLIIISEKSVKVIETKNFKTISIINTKKPYIFSNVDNNKLVILKPDNNLEVLDLKAGKVLKILKNKSPLNIITISGNRIITAFKNNYDQREPGKDLNIWDLNSGKLIKTVPYILGFIVNRDKIYANEHDGICNVIDLFTGKITDRIGNKFAYNLGIRLEKNRLIYQLNLLDRDKQKRDYKHITKYFNNVINFIDFENNKKINSIKDIGTINLSIVYEDKLLYTISPMGLIRIIDLKTGNLISTLKDKFYIDFSNIRIFDNKVMITSDSSSIPVKIFDIQTGNLLKSFDVKSSVSRFTLIENNVITGHDDGVINIWDYDSGKLINSIKAHDERITLLLVNKNKIISSLIYKNNIKVWSIKTGELLYEIKLPEHEDISEYSTSLTDDNLIIVSGIEHNKYQNIRIWDLKDGKLTKEILNSFVYDINKNEFYTLDNNSIKIFNKDNLNQIFSYDLPKMAKNMDIINTFIKNDYLFVSGKSFIESNKGKNYDYSKTKLWIWNNSTRNFINSIEISFNNIIGLNDKVLLTATENSGTAYWRLSDRKLLAIQYFFPTATFTITPEGYFSGEGNYKDYIYFLKDKL